jgi:hypothetical protein
MTEPAETPPAATVAAADPFGAARAEFEAEIAFLESEDAANLDHAALEDRLIESNRRVYLLLCQGYFDQRAAREPRLTVVDAEGVDRPYCESDHRRRLMVIFGEATVDRFAYRRRGQPNLYPADGALNPPAERYSHGLRRLAAIEATRGSFDETVAAIGRATGQTVGKRQAEELVRRAAADVDAFYAQIERPPPSAGEVLVLSADGKGIVMRPDSLRPATAHAAATSTTKLKTRLSKGEQANRKRMATVGAVYDLAPVPRTTADVLASKSAKPSVPAPRAKAKWVTASVAANAAQVIATVFAEADRRDPHHQRRWVAVVDGNQHQIERIEAEAAARDITVPVVVDLIHVLEYLWGAAWCFFPEGDPAAEHWVQDRALAILDGHAVQVAAGIRRRATTQQLSKAKRRKADLCADYLTHKAPYLDYPTALASGWPVASGIIEGACRYLVKDRMDITGARWGLDGAEAILKLRAVRANGDFGEYWKYHLAQEHRRLHAARYHDQCVPAAA